MNKTAIKNFAVRARRKLIEDITQKVYELGITENGIKKIETFEGGFMVHGVVNGRTYKKYEIKQREKLIEKINRSGYEHVVEEVAYTWFNRFIALRFMEVNEYLPTGVRILSSKEVGKIEPDIIKEALNVELDVDKDLVYRLTDENDTEDLYKYLLVKQCNELGKIMPMVFEEISDYTELLLPDNLLAEGSVIRDLVNSVEEEDYKDQVEIIGWMYQYYISEKKDEVFTDLKNNKKITKENIPAATQLFTPKWIVKYMVENSLGRLWLESHPDEELKAQWNYYLEEAEQDPEVKRKLDELKNPNLKPEDIKILDPSCGSGHILVYAFDVLYDIYLKANYSEREIPQLILEKNIYGLDIDDRAGQLAAFALMMKAKSKNKRIFRVKINLNVCSIQESNGITKEAIDYFIGTSTNINIDDVYYLVDVFHDAKEYGSILNVRKIDFAVIEERIEEIKNEDSKIFNLEYKEILLEKFPSLVKQGKILNEKYDIVCTNPPYMGSGGMNSKLSEFVKKKYKNSKSDLFAVFIERCQLFTKNNCFLSMITQHAWMFLSSFEKLRNALLYNDIVNMLHLGSRAFEEISGEVVQTTSFVLRMSNVSNFKSTYVRVVDYKSQQSKELSFLSGQNRYTVQKEEFSKIDGKIIAYWASNKLLSIFERDKLKKYGDSCIGMRTGDNARFLRFWFEVPFGKLGLHCKNSIEAIKSSKKWFPYCKGGSFRKWYGNNEYVVNWEDDGYEIKENTKLVYPQLGDNLGWKISNEHYYFKRGITWSGVGANIFGVRCYDEGMIFDSGANGFFSFDHSKYLYFAGLLNTNLINEIIKIMNPTINTGCGVIASLPTIIDENKITIINSLVNENISISKDDWDSFETSWDYKRHPLLIKKLIGYIDKPNSTIKEAFETWDVYSREQFMKLKSNEENINGIFIDIYGLQGEFDQEVEEKNITIRIADKERDIKSFISYAVGCMFGRYSLVEDGLIYAGGEFDIGRYGTYIPTIDNVIVIADDDYSEDDVVNRFVEFVKVTFGEETLEENLDYIAETLGAKIGDTSRQSIRRYFLKDFYNDHVKTYQKRPIYWLFDSGKQNGFKAFIYMHRYEPSTAARVRIDYLHKLQKKYEAEVNRLDMLLESDLEPRDAAVAKKRKENISKQIQECLAYDQVIAHVANQKIEIDLDDGVVVNYEKFQNVEVPQGEGKKPIKANLLAKL